MKFVPELQIKLLRIIYCHDKWKHSCYYIDDFVDQLEGYKESSIKYHIRLLVKSNLVLRIRAIPTFYEPIDSLSVRNAVCESVKAWQDLDSSGKS